MTSILLGFIQGPRGLPTRIEFPLRKPLVQANDWRWFAAR